MSHRSPPSCLARQGSAPSSHITGSVGTTGVETAKAEGFAFPTDTGSRRNRSSCAHLAVEGTSLGATDGGHSCLGKYSSVSVHGGNLFSAAWFHLPSTDWDSRTCLRKCVCGNLDVSYDPLDTLQHNNLLCCQSGVLPWEGLCQHQGQTGQS